MASTPKKLTPAQVGKIDLCAVSCFNIEDNHRLEIIVTRAGSIYVAVEDKEPELCAVADISKIIEILNGTRKYGYSLISGIGAVTLDSDKNGVYVQYGSFIGKNTEEVMPEFCHYLSQIELLCLLRLFTSYTELATEQLMLCDEYSWLIVTKQPDDNVSVAVQSLDSCDEIYRKHGRDIEILYTSGTPHVSNPIYEFYRKKPSSQFATISVGIAAAEHVNAWCCA